VAHERGFCAVVGGGIKVFSVGCGACGVTVAVSWRCLGFMGAKWG